MKNYCFLRVVGWVLIICITTLPAKLESKSDFRATEYVVGKIFITGNQKFSTSRLKRLIDLKERRIWRSKTFTRRLLALDRLALENTYVKNGYLYATVRDSFQVHPNHVVDIFFSISEGQQYFFKDLTVSGTQLLSDKKIRAIIAHKKGQPYNPIQIRNGIKTIQTEYANIGKPLAVIRDSIAVEDGIHLFLNIQENRTMHVGDIHIRNNQKVKDRPIRREIVLKPGDLYSLEKVELSKRHIYETGLFSSVSIHPSDFDTTKNQLNLIVNVRELDMHYFGVNFGLGQDRGLTPGSEPYTSFDIAGEWLNRNIAGRGSRFSINLETALNMTDIFRQPRTAAEIVYIEPWLLGFRSSNSFRLFFENQVLEEQSRTSFGGEIALIYQPERRFYLKSGVEIRGIKFSTEVDPTAVNPLDRERAISLTLRRDYRDNFLFPKNGSLLTTSGKIVGTILGGTQDYYKFEVSYSQYFQILGPIVLAYRAKLGLMESLSADDPPLYEQFYLGGSTSMRGWREREFLRKSGNPIGANAKALTSAEIRFPLFWLLGGEIFVDGGNMADEFKTLLGMTYRWDAGLGLTIASPLGPIRVDYAKKLPIKGEDQDNLWQIQFGIPYSF